MSTRQDPPNQDLNLVPVMNLVTILIPFLLMASEFVSISVVDTTLPGICGAPCGADPKPDPDPQPPLNLSITVHKDGYTILGNDLGLADIDDRIEIRCIDGDCEGAGYDNAELNRVLAQVKMAHPHEENLVLVPSQNTSYGTLIEAMDGSRQSGKDELFPYVVIAGGTQ